VVERTPFYFTALETNCLRHRRASVEGFSEIHYRSVLRIGIFNQFAKSEIAFAHQQPGCEMKDTLRPKREYT
jgi:hypothetical protein